MDKFVTMRIIFSSILT